MELSEEIFAYGMSQNPVASSRRGPLPPFDKWCKEVAQLEAKVERLMGIIEEAASRGIGADFYLQEFLDALKSGE
jgi:hypothetical protein